MHSLLPPEWRVEVDMQRCSKYERMVNLKCEICIGMVDLYMLHALRRLVSAI